MSTPTPGPWRVTEMKHTVGRAVWAGSGTEEYRVCGVGLSHVPGRMEANAALISAAPDLLAALQQATDGARQDWDSGTEPTAWFEAARAAISKAVQS